MTLVAARSSAGIGETLSAKPEPEPALVYADLGPASQFDTDSSWTAVVLPKEFGKATLYIRKTPAAMQGAAASHPSNATLPPQYQALSARCTHRGCTVGYDKGSRTFLCPCHQGQFDDAGKNVSGPPRRPLASLDAKIDSNNHLLVAVPPEALPQKK